MLNTYLVGVDSTLTVTDITQHVMDKLKVTVLIEYEEQYCGWKGDVSKYSDDVTKPGMLGWSPKYTAEDAIRKANKENK